MNFKDEEEVKKVAAQLRKPDGEAGREIGALMNDGNGPMNRHTLAVVDPQPNDRILEIGMGNGHFVKNILKLDTSISYAGYDYSQIMVEEASRNNWDYVEEGRALFAHGNAEQMPFEENSFTKAFTVNTLYFWEDRSKILSEFWRVLQPEGTLIIAVRPKRNMELYPVTKYGFSMFSKEEILELLAENGFVNPTVTEIQEPPQSRFGTQYDRESLIITSQTEG